MSKLCDTVAAVSTPRGKGGVALLRVSGADAFSVCEKVFRPFHKTKLTDYPPRTEVYGEILSFDGQGNATPLDDGMACYFVAPNSFTGENTVEICCHGGMLLTEMVLSSILSAGARSAERGEFTRRAFLNGKMGLSSCEALGDVLEAQTEKQVLLSHHNLHGTVDKESDAIYKTLLRILSSVQVLIDYPDEDLSDVSREDLVGMVKAQLDAVTKLRSSYRTGKAIAQGVKTVILGKPNVGKSSLYNALLGKDSAIVTSVAGTTRDVLESVVSFGGVTLRLLDTAGIRATEDEVEKIGVEKAKRESDDAELLLLMFDAARPLDGEDLELLETFEKKENAVLLLNKTDAGIHPDFRSARFADAIRISVKEHSGLDELKNRIEKQYYENVDIEKDPVLTNARQFASVSKAGDALENAYRNLTEGYPIDMCLRDVEIAMEGIAELEGREISDDIVTDIFSRFCVGK